MRTDYEAEISHEDWQSFNFFSIFTERSPLLQAWGRGRRRGLGRRGGRLRRAPALGPPRRILGGLRREARLFCVDFPLSGGEIFGWLLRVFSFPTTWDCLTILRFDGMGIISHSTYLAFIPAKVRRLLKPTRDRIFKAGLFCRFVLVETQGILFGFFGKSANVSC